MSVSRGEAEDGTGDARVNMNRPIVEDQPAQSRTINFNPPPFWKQNVQLWFKQVESQFRVKGVTADEDKYDLIVSALDTSVLTQVSDLVIEPPPIDKYQTLKQRIINCFCESEEKKLQILLKEIALGDKKPSQLLREMRELTSNKVSEELLKTLWMQHLPNNVRGILSVSSDQTLAALVPLADKIMEMCKPETSICALEQPTVAGIHKYQADRATDDRYVRERKEMLKKIEELTQQVEKLTNACRFRPKRGRSHSRQRSQVEPCPESEQQKYCRFHRKYGSDAYRCEPPCKFPKKKPENY